MPLASFQELLQEAMAEYHPQRSIDELLIHPEQAMKICSLVRTRAGATELADDLILRCLLADRKSSQRQSA